MISPGCREKSFRSPAISAEQTKSRPWWRRPRQLLGPVDILVNNSATNVGQGPSLEVTDEMLDKMIEINIKAALRLVRLTVPRMIERGSGGSIINVSSISGLRPQPMGLLYSFTKAGLIMMTRSWAREFGSRRHPRQRPRARPDSDRFQRVFLGG